MARFSWRLVALYFAAFGTLSVFADTASAKLSHKNGRRSRARQGKRQTCATPTISEAASSSSVSLSTSASAVSSSLTQDEALLLVNSDGGGHWQLTTGSFWFVSTSSQGGLSSASTPSSMPSTVLLSTSSSRSSLSLSNPSPGTTTPEVTTTTATSATTNRVIPTGSLSNLGPSTSSTDKHVFAHFMIGICSTYQQQDYVNDMTLAMKSGITAFALNIGIDWYTEEQLGYAYAAAAEIGFAVFISFDFNWYTTSNTSGVISMLSLFAHDHAQLTVDGKIFVSTFIGDGFDWGAVATGVGAELYVVPYWDNTAANAGNTALSGLFSWYAWPGQPDNIPVNASMTCENDLQYISTLNADGKPYMAPVSPWFFTHFGTEVSYSKNFMFKSETLWKYRWDQILALGTNSSLNFIEIVTWNDFGESHYIGPYNTPHTDDGSSAWAAGFDHSPMLTFAEPYIAAFRSGASAPVISTDTLTYWHRPHLKSASCDSTDICGSPPTGYEFVDDVVFVATMTQNGGSFTMTSGANAPVNQTVEAGVQIFEIPMTTGTQSFTFTTESGFGSTTSNITVSADCWVSDTGDG